MGEFSEEVFENKLTTLKDTQDSIQSLSLWCLKHQYHHKQIVGTWLRVLKKAKIEQRLLLFYLANDVIQHSKRKNYPFIDTWATALQRATPLVREDKVRNKVLRLFKIWDERSIYDESFIVDLSGLLKTKIKKPPAKQETADPIGEFQPTLLFNKIRLCKRLEDDTDLKLKTLKEDELPMTDLELLQSTIKERKDGDVVLSEIDNGIEKMENYIKALKHEIQERVEVIEILEVSEMFYDTQRGEAKIVCNAYRNFANRIKILKKKLEETISHLSTPVSSPDINAPSPSSGSDIVIPEDNNSSSAADITYDTEQSFIGMDFASASREFRMNKMYMDSSDASEYMNSESLNASYTPNAISSYTPAGSSVLQTVANDSGYSQYNASAMWDPTLEESSYNPSDIQDKSYGNIDCPTSLTEKVFRPSVPTLEADETLQEEMGNQIEVINSADSGNSEFCATSFFKSIMSANSGQQVDTNLKSVAPITSSEMIPGLDFEIPAAVADSFPSFLLNREDCELGIDNDYDSNVRFDSTSTDLPVSVPSLSTTANIDDKNSSIERFRNYNTSSINMHGDTDNRFPNFNSPFYNEQNMLQNVSNLNNQQLVSAFRNDIESGTRVNNQTIHTQNLITLTDRSPDGARLSLTPSQLLDAEKKMLSDEMGISYSPLSDDAMDTDFGDKCLEGHQNENLTKPNMESIDMEMSDEDSSERSFRRAHDIKTNRGNFDSNKLKRAFPKDKKNEDIFDAVSPISDSKKRRSSRRSLTPVSNLPKNLGYSSIKTTNEFDNQENDRCSNSKNRPDRLVRYVSSNDSCKNSYDGSSTRITSPNTLNYNKSVAEQTQDKAISDIKPIECISGVSNFNVGYSSSENDYNPEEDFVNDNIPQFFEEPVGNNKPNRSNLKEISISDGGSDFPSFSNQPPPVDCSLPYLNKPPPGFETFSKKPDTHPRNLNISHEKDDQDFRNTDSNMPHMLLQHSPNQLNIAKNMNAMEEATSQIFREQRFGNPLFSQERRFGNKNVAGIDIDLRNNEHENQFIENSIMNLPNLNIKLEGLHNIVNIEEAQFLAMEHRNLENPIFRAMIPNSPLQPRLPLHFLAPPRERLPFILPNIINRPAGLLIPVSSPQRLPMIMNSFPGGEIHTADGIIPFSGSNLHPPERILLPFSNNDIMLNESLVVTTIQNDNPQVNMGIQIFESSVHGNAPICTPLASPYKPRESPIRCKEPVRELTSDQSTLEAATTPHLQTSVLSASDESAIQSQTHLTCVPEVVGISDEVGPSHEVGPSDEVETAEEAGRGDEVETFGDGGPSDEVLSNNAEAPLYETSVSPSVSPQHAMQMHQSPQNMMQIQQSQHSMQMHQSPQIFMQQPHHSPRNHPPHRNPQMRMRLPGSNPNYNPQMRMPPPNSNQEHIPQMRIRPPNSNPDHNSQMRMRPPNFTSSHNPRMPNISNPNRFRQPTAPSDIRNPHVRPSRFHHFGQRGLFVNNDTDNDETRQNSRFRYPSVRHATQNQPRHPDQMNFPRRFPMNPRMPDGDRRNMQPRFQRRGGPDNRFRRAW